MGQRHRFPMRVDQYFGDGQRHLHAGVLQLLCQQVLLGQDRHRRLYAGLRFQFVARHLFLRGQ